MNIVKHARANHVQVLMRRDADAIRIIIEDDGIGFPAGQWGDGFGLRRTIRGRVARRGGIVTLGRSSLGGARVTLSTIGGERP